MVPVRVPGGTGEERGGGRLGRARKRDDDTNADAHGWRTRGGENDRRRDGAASTAPGDYEAGEKEGRGQETFAPAQQ